MISQISAFDYGQHNSKTALALKDYVTRINSRLRRSIYEIVEVGKMLIEAKEIISHGDFTDWVRAEFEMSERTAQRFLNVAKRFEGKTDSLTVFSLEILYELASSSTPDEVIEQVIEKARNGETPNLPEVKQLKKEAKAKKDPKIKYSDLDLTNIRNFTDEEMKVYLAEQDRLAEIEEAERIAEENQAYIEAPVKTYNDKFDFDEDEEIAVETVDQVERQRLNEAADARSLARWDSVEVEEIGDEQESEEPPRVYKLGDRVGWIEYVKEHPSEQASEVVEFGEVIRIDGINPRVHPDNPVLEDFYAPNGFLLGLQQEVIEIQNQKLIDESFPNDEDTLSKSETVAHFKDGDYAEFNPKFEKQMLHLCPDIVVRDLYSLFEVRFTNNGICLCKGGTPEQPMMLNIPQEWLYASVPHEDEDEDEDEGITIVDQKEYLIIDEFVAKGLVKDAIADKHISKETGSAILKGVPGLKLVDESVLRFLVCRAVLANELIYQTATQILGIELEDLPNLLREHANEKK